jgi:hypothetical protein
MATATVGSSKIWPQEGECQINGVTELGLTGWA